MGDEDAKAIQKCWKDAFCNSLLPDEAQKRWEGLRGKHIPATAAVLADRLKQGKPIEYATTAGTDSRRSTVEHTVPRRLVLCTGFSEEQLALSIAVHAMQSGGTLEVVPFGTRPSWTDACSRVRTMLRAVETALSTVFKMPNIVDQVEVKDGADQALIFLRLLKWARELTDVRSLAIDVTGGQKPMHGAASMFAMYYGIPSYYLDFGEYDSKLRRPKPWTCSYREQVMPEAALSLQSRQRICNAVERRDFAAAEVLVTELVDQSNGKLADYFEKADKTAIALAQASIGHCRAFAEQRYSDLPDCHTSLKNWAQNSKTLQLSERMNSLVKNTEAVTEFLVDDWWRLKSLEDTDRFDEEIVGRSAFLELAVSALLVVAAKDGIEVQSLTPKEQGSAPYTQGEQSLVSKTLDAALAVGLGANTPERIKLIYGAPRRVSFDVTTEPSALIIEPNQVLTFDHGSGRRSISLKVVLKPGLVAYCNPLKKINARADWVQFRHQIVHMRGSLSADDRDSLPDARTATKIALDALLVATRRVATPAPWPDDGLAWETTNGFSRKERDPYFKTMDSLPDQLRLTLDASGHS